METKNGLTDKEIHALLDHQESADLIYYEFYDKHFELIKGMLMQFCFADGIVKTNVYGKTDWSILIYKKDFPAYYVLTKNIEYNRPQQIPLAYNMEPHTITLRLDGVKEYLEKDTYPSNAILALFIEWLRNSNFVLDMSYLFENDIHIKNTAKELNIL